MVAYRPGQKGGRFIYRVECIQKIGLSPLPPPYTFPVEAQSCRVVKLIDEDRYQKDAKPVYLPRCLIPAISPKIVLSPLLYSFMFLQLFIFPLISLRFFGSEDLGLALQTQ